MDWLVIRTYISEFPANLAKATLEGSGIDTMLRKDDGGGMRPYLQAATGIQLLVRQDDAERADKILRNVENEESDEQ